MEVSRKNPKEENAKSEYKVGIDALTEHPGFAAVIFVSWDKIAEYFDLFDCWDLYKEGTEVPEEFVNVAFSGARNWASIFTQKNNFPPSDDQIVKKENDILHSLQQHWSPEKILLDKFCFEQFVSDVNGWSCSGAKSIDLFGGNPPPPGKSLEYFITSLGINFTVYEPFMIPYTEIYYVLYEDLPEWNFDEVEGMDIVETLFAVQDQKGNDTTIELDDWASTWEFSDESPTTHIEPEMEDLFAD